MALVEMNFASGGGGTDHFQKLLGMGEYDRASSTQTVPSGTDYIVILPLWISGGVGTNGLYKTPSAYQGELYYLENVGNSVTIPTCYQDNNTYTNQTTVTWTSETQLNISRQSINAGVFCFYFANK